MNSLSGQICCYHSGVCLSPSATCSSQIHRPIHRPSSVINPPPGSAERIIDFSRETIIIWYDFHPWQWCPLSRTEGKHQATEKIDDPWWGDCANVLNLYVRSVQFASEGKMTIIVTGWVYYVEDIIFWTRHDDRPFADKIIWRSPSSRHAKCIIDFTHPVLVLSTREEERWTDAWDGWTGFVLRNGLLNVAPLALRR